jgi:hypothetical protein
MLVLSILIIPLFVIPFTVDLTHGQEVSFESVGWILWAAFAVEYEDAATKARRLLTEGRLAVRSVDAERMVARCRGDSAEMYDVGFDPAGWHCSCPGHGRCSHARALRLVVLVRAG